MTTSRTRKADSGDQAEKSTAKKSESTAKKSESTAKKSESTATKSASGRTRKRASAPRAAAKPRTSGLQVATEAARQLLELTGKAAEGVTSMERTEDGWKIQVEVLEMRRIPETTDVLAIYEIDTDDKGEIEGYRRLRRYVRGAPGEE